MQELLVKTNGIELQVRDYQQPEPAVIFLHFSGANLMMWQRVVPYFQDQFRVILVDLRGHGKSDVPDSGYHMDVMAQDVIGVMDHLKIAKAHIVGSSLGAEVGLSLAANYPQRVISLVLDGAMNSEFGPYGLWEGSEEEFNEHVTNQVEKIRTATTQTFPTLETFMESRQAVFEKYDWWNEFVAEMERYGARRLADGQYAKGFSNQSNAAYMQNYFQYRFEEYYLKVRCPILMLVNKELEEGREKEVMLGLKDHAIQADLAEIKDWEHPYLWMLDPDEACIHIKQFLESI